MSHGYSHCPGNPSNPCVYARKCPYHGDAEACARDVRDQVSDKERARRRQKLVRESGATP
jgi:hypothetical protein